LKNKTIEDHTERTEKGWSESTNFSAYLRRIETAKPDEWGYAAFERIKTALII
jgi:hypothetical protein